MQTLLRRRPVEPIEPIGNHVVKHIKAVTTTFVELADEKQFADNDNAFDADFPYWYTRLGGRIKDRQHTKPPYDAERDFTPKNEHTDGPLEFLEFGDRLALLVKPGL
mmetsp:Transcript_3663/g.8296  ORF Transcript_3663/g.8296 Transcript_3663/m.8296 type:complete len:107 (+) Transcript_3663:168-488(+)